MTDDKHMTDAELQKLLNEISVPEPDANEKLGALNMAESRFAENVKKNEQIRQGNANGARLMDVIHDTFIFMTGGKNMKKSYAITGMLAIALAGTAYVATNSNLNKSFKTVSNQLGPVGGNSYGTPIPAAPPAARQRAQEFESDAAVQAAPELHANAPMMEAKRELAKPSASRAQTESFAAGATADMAYSIAPSPMPAPGLIMPHEPMPIPQYENRDKFEGLKDNPVKSAQAEPVSTFSIDVDTSSYAVVRRALNNGILPNSDAVRVEELVNYFDYDYAVPESKAEPFKPTVALYETPWNPDTVLMHVGIKGHEMAADAPKPHSNLVFLIDVSGSMSAPDKLPLLQQSFRMLVNTLGEDDTISIVTYAGHAGVALEPTKVANKQTILNAIDNLRSGGSTAGAEGIRTAYQLAEQQMEEEGVNRVILATDGDFNVGINDPEQLKKFIADKRDSGVYLSVLGFGQGNYNDAIMQTLAQNGNGNAAYIDSINEARKVLVDEATSTLYPIANDVKIQVEFNPLKVAEYRLIGYATRMLNREDFNNDKIDAGDIGAGHTVTAIYEVTPVGSKAQLIDDLRYAQPQAEEKPMVQQGGGNEYAFLKMRYKLPGEKTSQLLTRPITDADMGKLANQSDDIRFAAAVAAFGQKLRDESYVSDYGYDKILELATSARGQDPYNYRGEFVNLVRNAEVAQQRGTGTNTERMPY